MGDPGGPFSKGGRPWPSPPPGVVAPGVVDPRSGLPYAGFGQRVGAYLLDSALLVGAWLGVGLLGTVASSLDETLGASISLVAAVVLLVGSVLLLIMGDGGALGQTPGKHLVGIKVVGPRPGPIGYGQGALRYVGRILDSVICCVPVGLLWPLIDDERRAWHDMVADTRVVVAPPGDRSLGYWWQHFRIGPGGVESSRLGEPGRASAGPSTALFAGLGVTAVAIVAAVAIVVTRADDDASEFRDHELELPEDEARSGAPPAETESGGPSTSAAVPPDRSVPPIRIGAQDFGESAILAEIYEQALDARGFDATVHEVGGFRDQLFTAFEAGDIDLAPDYVASELAFLTGNDGEPSGDVDEAFARLQDVLQGRGLTGLQPSPAVDTPTFVVTADTASTYGLATLSDLARVGEGFTLGATSDCATDSHCLPGLQSVYSVDLAPNFVSLDFGEIATSLERAEIDVAVLFSTDSRIPAKGWVRLADDRGMLAPDNIFPVATQEVVAAHDDDLTSTLDSVTAALTTDDLAELNLSYDIDRQDVESIAAAWLADHDVAS